ncbi:MAG TPA: PIN domain-containing protein [Thermoanaerobaculia bacterium]|nr:PIN domain-containing protein [Thermoanaerobaculia bacterium]
MKLLADTSALLALLFRDDRNHRAAAGFAQRSPQARFLLTELIFGEVVTRLRARAGAERAVAVARDLLRSSRYELIFLDEGVLSGALARMARFADKRLSLTDCASFEVMERLSLNSAFSFDRDFRDCGFAMFPEGQ